MNLPMRYCSADKADHHNNRYKNTRLHQARIVAGSLPHGYGNSARTVSRLFKPFPGSLPFLNLVTGKAAGAHVSN
jgi:hypothetical protein